MPYTQQVLSQCLFHYNDPEQVKSVLFSIFSSFFCLIRIFVVVDDVVLFLEVIINFKETYQEISIQVKKYLQRRERSKYFWGEKHTKIVIFPIDNIPLELAFSTPNDSDESANPGLGLTTWIKPWPNSESLFQIQTGIKRLVPNCYCIILKRCCECACC